MNVKSPMRGPFDSLRFRRFGLLTAAVFLATSLMAVLLPFGSLPVSAQSQFTFSGKGWGHGVGMSQYGAFGRAADGHNHREILSFYYPGTVLETRSEPTDIRVWLASANTASFTPEGNNRLVLDGRTLGRAVYGSRIRVSLNNNLWTVSTTSGVLCSDCSGDTLNLLFATGTSVFVSTTGRSYLHGRFTFTKVNANEFRIVLDNINMEHYLYGIAEMPNDWPIEALKSQAVSARSYAMTRISQRRGGGWSLPFDLYATVSDQAYRGNSQELASNSGNWKEAVHATRGQVLTYNGSIIATFYASSNGGHTERSDVAFSYSLPYLAAKPDSYDSYMNPFAEWSRTYSASQLSGWLNRYGDTHIGTIQRISINNTVGGSGRINDAEVVLGGTEGTKEITGNRLFQVINAGVIAGGHSYSRQLYSTLLFYTPGGGIDFSVSTYRAPPASATSSSQSAGVAAQPKVVLPTTPVGKLEGFEISGGSFFTKGWAYDGETQESLKVSLFLDGNLFAEVKPEQNRPDIFKEKGYGLKSGFREKVSLTGGKGIVCAIARDAMEIKSLGCASHGLGDVRPIGEVLDIKASGSGFVEVKGWAYDPDTDKGINIKVSANGRLIGLTTASETIEDIATTNPLGSLYGFSGKFSLPRGANEVCVEAVNSGTKGSISKYLGCWRI